MRRPPSATDLPLEDPQVQQSEEQASDEHADEPLPSWSLATLGSIAIPFTWLANWLPLWNLWGAPLEEEESAAAA